MQDEVAHFRKFNNEAPRLKCSLLVGLGGCKIIIASHIGTMTRKTASSNAQREKDIFQKHLDVFVDTKRANQSRSC
jgi:hypothetical protein